MRRRSGDIIFESIDSGTQYFALSYKLPADFRSAEREQGQWAVLFQLHGPDSLNAPPAFALRVTDEKYYIVMNGGDLSAGNRWRTIDFSDAGLNLGKWVDFVIMIRFSANSSGQVTVWRRNEGDREFREIANSGEIPTLQYNEAKGIAPGPHYWKQGLYRSAFDHINVFWMGPTARASTFSAAEQAAFGTASGFKQ
jgi:hypothetical protein